MAAGAVVVSLCSTSDETIEEAEKDLPRNSLPADQKQLRFRQNRQMPPIFTFPTW